MDLMKTMLLYMSLALTSAVGDAPMPTPTPAPTATPAPIVTPAPAVEKDPVEEVLQQATATPAPAKTAEKEKAEKMEAPEMTPNPKYRLLKKGVRGEEVRKLQRRLKELGYLQAEVDGVYGDRTKGAVMRFQQAHGLSRDGVAGKHTQTVLYEYDGVIADPSVATPAPAPTAEPTAVPTPVPTAEPTVAPTQIPVLKAEELPVTGTPVPALTEILPQTLSDEETEEPETAEPETEESETEESEVEETSEITDTQGVKVLPEGKVTVDGMELEASDLLALSADGDVLVDVEGLCETLEWDPDPVMEGLGWEIELGEHTLTITYSLYNDALDLVSVTCDGEDVELTEAMTGLCSDRLYLAPVWLEAVGAATQWDADSKTLNISFE